MTDLFRNHLWKGSRGEKAANEQQGVKIEIAPGQVEEAVRAIPFTGAIDVSGLNFYAYPREDEMEMAKYASVDDATTDSGTIAGMNEATTQAFEMDSIVDIAVFEVANDQCTSQSCDISKYGVGQLEHFDQMAFMSLCKDGRLRINRDAFTGLHVEVRIPAHGVLPDRQIADGDGIISVPESGCTYEVLIANCNKHGRKLLLTGQVLFDVDEGISQNVVPPTNLVLFGMAICLIFSFLNIRIRFGTRIESNYEEFSGQDDSHPGNVPVSNADGGTSATV
jgi:hypothetical protein